MNNPRLFYGVLCLLLCTLPVPAFAQEAGESVRLRGAITEDVYAAGGSVDVSAVVEGDVVVAGGTVTIGERVSGDVMAAGGSVNVQADVGDDVRLAGGDVRLSGAIGDDAIAAGGNVMLAPESTVGGRAWLSGGHIEVAGDIGRELKAAGDRIVLSGHVRGDVVITGRAISVLDSAIIDGNLHYRSEREADIASGAQIRGTVSHEPVEYPIVEMVATAATVGVLVLLNLIVAGSALFLLLPRVVESAVDTLRAEPWKCGGLGLAVFAATPVVTGILFMTLIGGLTATVTIVLYALLLLTGFLTAVFYVGDFGLGWRKQSTGSRGRPLLSFALALIAVLLLGLVPLLGALLLFVLLWLGTGALTLVLYRLFGLPANRQPA